MKNKSFLTMIAFLILALLGCGPIDEEPEQPTSNLAFTQFELDGLVMMNQAYMDGGLKDNFKPEPGASLLIFSPGILWAIGVEAEMGTREKYNWKIGSKGQLLMTRNPGSNYESSCELWKTKHTGSSIDTRFKCNRSTSVMTTTYHLPQNFIQRDMHNLTLTFKGDDDTAKRDILYTSQNIRKRLDYYSYKTWVEEPYIIGDYKNSLSYPIYAVTPSPNSGRARLFLFGHPVASDGTLLELGYSEILVADPAAKGNAPRSIGHKLHSVSLIKNLVYGDPQNKYDLHSRSDLEVIPY